MTRTRAELLDRLAVLNRALARQGAAPIVTGDEAQALPADNLQTVVHLTADRVVTVARALDGMP